MNNHNVITPRNLFISELAIIRNAIINMEWREFEIFSAKLFAFTGDYTYEVTPKTNDEGKDVILKKKGEVVYLECKHHSNNKIGREVAQKLCGAMIADNISLGIIVTLNGANNKCLEYLSKLEKSKIVSISIRVVNLDDLILKCLTLNAHTVFEMAGIPDKYVNVS
ncbi:HJR/Mrr/RecB family endonuclease [Clostridium pascui]|uniref:restriction endonuclease n=1 Tax=Clostridium pascui TaxID=46609 RepID=UPI001957B6E6|nr:restriction endonuclease [Clostridium pascui]MBM7869252.1 HJR/Mrr/RecB family endonuclease [Clostridium pascui]